MTDSADWPARASWDLGQAFAALAAGVGGLELALTEGNLEARLADPAVCAAVGPAIVRAYEKLPHAVPAPFLGPRRTDAVNSLIAQARAEVKPANATFDAEMGSQSTGGFHGTGIASCVRVLDPEPVVLRLDQACSVRYWGIGFTFADPTATVRLERTMLRETAGRFAVDLSDMAVILARIRADDRYPPLRPKTRAFERLMFDILNEHRCAATLAPLAADYSQKTDLRYDTLRGLGRQRGARVQVTALTDFAMHDAKLGTIENREKLVYLSPVELARWIDDEVHARGPFPEPLDRELLRRLWQAIGTPADVPTLCEAIAASFSAALKNQKCNVRGPLDYVPGPVRELVRAWVDRSAQRSTRLLRAFESRYGQDTRGDGGRIYRRHASATATPADAWADFRRSHRPGSRTIVRVAEISAGAWWGSVGGCIPVYVLDGSGHQPAVGEELEVVLLDHSDDHRWSTAIPVGA
ncbi:MAG: hypothetical protein ABIP94_11015, partial [Planctomycetota bacterium]